MKQPDQGGIDRSVHCLSGRQKRPALRRAVITSLICVLSACTVRDGDQPANVGQVTPLGTGDRIREVSNPDNPKHPAIQPGDSANVRLSAATIVHVDTFDETRDGKSRGTVYVQDLSSKEPYSGISIYAPAFVPADLRVAPGDVVDFSGPYTELSSIGAAVFTGGLVVQLAKPVGTFRYEFTPPEPTDIDVNDLVDFKTGRRWMGMLVRIKNLTIPTAPFASKGRLTVAIAGDIRDNKSNPPQVSNELFDLQADTIAQGKTFKSVVGVVTYFFSLKIAPRSMADLEVGP